MSAAVRTTALLVHDLAYDLDDVSARVPSTIHRPPIAARHTRSMFAAPPAKRIGAPPTPSTDLSQPAQGLDYHRWVQADVELPSLAPDDLA